MPKAGADASDCEDAWAISADQLRYALADGATDSAYPAVWAQSLVDCFVKEFSCPEFESPAALNAWLAPQRKRWQESVPWDSLPWYGQEKAERGAFATFLGCDFEWREKTLHWHAVAVGDTCLVHLRGHELLRAFPVANSAGFTNTPGLLASSEQLRPRPIDVVRSLHGTLAANESIVLATDALAQWLISELEQAHRPLEQLDRLQSQQDFAAFVDQQRQQGTLPNDDTTMILIRRAAVEAEKES